MITLAIAKTIIAGAQDEAAKSKFKPLTYLIYDTKLHWTQTTFVKQPYCHVPLK